MKNNIIIIIVICFYNMSWAIDSSLIKCLQQNGNIKANFVQKVTSGNKTSVTRGQVIISRPNKFKWIYTVDSKQMVISNGKEVYIYDPDLNQVIIKHLFQLINQSPAAVLAGSNDLSISYDVHYLGSKNSYIYYKLTAKKSVDNNGFSYIVLVFDKNQQIKQMTLLDTFNNQIEIIFSNVSYDIGDYKFYFKIFKGVDVINETK